MAVGVSVVLLHAPICAAETGVAAPDDAEEQSFKTEINKDVTDPVSLTWSLKTKNTITLLDIEGHGNQPQYQLQFQPTLPALLTPGLKLIARPQFTFVDDKPFTSQGELQRATGFGDTILDLVLSPVSDPWLLALGPTFVFPTASLDRTGQGKWQAGPAGVLGYRAKIWLAGVIAEQWFSFAGAESRPAVSQLNLQYIASYFFGDGWSIGTDPTIKFNWRASAGNKVTFPLGPVVGKVVKIAGTPVKLEIDLNYVPVHPDPNGPQFIFQLKVIPVVPALLAGPLFNPG